MREEIVIRNARPRDRNAILSFTQSTFRWGDYLSYVWTDWLRSPHGKLLVAEVDGKVVGNLHAAFLGAGDAWFEGMRVHPGYRKHGIAALLDARAREIARESGCRVVRLMTAANNHPAQSALASFGYHLILALREWSARTLKGEVKNVRQGNPDDESTCMDIWEHSWMRRKLHSLAPQVNPWHWASFSRRHLHAAFNEGRVWISPAEGQPKAFALLSEDQDVFEAMLFAGKGALVGHLMRNIRNLARHAGHSSSLLVGPDSYRFHDWARREGYERRGGGMLVYEQKL